MAHLTDLHKLAALNSQKKKWFIVGIKSKKHECRKLDLQLSQISLSQSYGIPRSIFPTVTVFTFFCLLYD